MDLMATSQTSVVLAYLELRFAAQRYDGSPLCLQIPTSVFPQGDVTLCERSHGSRICLRDHDRF